MVTNLFNLLHNVFVRTLRFTDPFEACLPLLKKAAEYGNQQLIEMIFNSSAGRIIFNGNKHRFPLLEGIARNHGQEQTAHYFQKISARFFKDVTQEDPKKIEWPESHESGEAIDGTEEKNPQLEGSVESDSFHGDVESLSSDSLEQTLDAEDDLSEIISKVSVKENEIQVEENTAEKDERDIIYQPSETQETHSPLNEDAFSLKESVNWDRISVKPVTMSSDQPLPFGNNGKFSKQLIVKRQKHNKHILEGHCIFQSKRAFKSQIPQSAEREDCKSTSHFFPPPINAE